MYEFSAVDGFVEISESLGEMIKYLANEPSVGLYYIQQHAQNAVPNVIHLKNNVGEKSHDSVLHAEDLEDSISAVKSMKECGFPIAEEMIKDIKKSLALMSTKQPARGLIQPTSPSLWTGGSNWSPATWNRSSANSQGNGEKTMGYLSNVIKTAKQKAGNLKWSPLDLRELREFGAEESLSYPDSTHHKHDSNEPTESNSADNPEQTGDATVDDNRSFNYDSFKADREANLEDWLKDNENMDQQRNRQY